MQWGAGRATPPVAYVALAHVIVKARATIHVGTHCTVGCEVRYGKARRGEAMTGKGRRCKVTQGKARHGVAQSGKAMQGNMR